MKKKAAPKAPQKAPQKKGVKVTHTKKAVPKKAEAKHDPVAAAEVLSKLSNIKIVKTESNPETWASSGQPEGTQLYSVSCTKDGASISGGKTQMEQFVLEHAH